MKEPVKLISVDDFEHFRSMSLTEQREFLSYLIESYTDTDYQNMIRRFKLRTPVRQVLKVLRTDWYLEPNIKRRG